MSHTRTHTHTLRVIHILGVGPQRHNVDNRSWNTTCVKEGVPVECWAEVAGGCGWGVVLFNSTRRQRCALSNVLLSPIETLELDRDRWKKKIWRCGGWAQSTTCVVLSKQIVVRTTLRKHGVQLCVIVNASS